MDVASRLLSIVVQATGRRRCGQVMAKEMWADGSVYYQLELDVHGDTRVTPRLYQ
ncbi:hypothetical protein ACWD5F_13825 [Streptomyces sp. NPDC002499]